MQPRLRGALSTITAAVVGVILNLSVWFALHVLFDSVNKTVAGPFHLWVPDVFSLNWVVLLRVTLCAFASFKFHWNIVKILILSALLGFLLSCV